MATEPADDFQPLPSHYHRCFGCGQDHPHGLHLSMEGSDHRVRGSFLVTEAHQGAPGLAHGGVVAAAVDEGMGFLLWLLRTPAVTAHLELDYRRPVPVGERLELEAEVERVEGRKIHARLIGRVNGDVAVEAKALYLMVGLEHFEPYIRELDEPIERPTYNP